MRQVTKTVAVGAVALAMLTIGGYGAYSLLGMVAPGSSAGRPKVVASGPPSADQAARTATAFLAAWSQGDLEAASQLTDDPQGAVVALTAFRTNLKPTSLALALAPGGPATGASPAPGGDGDQVVEGFGVTAAFAGAAGPWQYDGRLAVGRRRDGTPAVHWAPSVIHPLLGAGQTLTTQQVLAPPTSLTDRNGKPLTGLPSLPPIVAGLRQDSPGDPADAGSAVVVTDAAGHAQGQPLFTITAPKGGQPVRLTIDATLQAAAEKAVQEQYAKGGRTSAMVAVEPSTGHILAIANAPATDFDTALLGATAPGSTMKVITATALLQAGLSPDAAMPCPSSYTVGQSYRNDFPDARPNYTLAQDFAASCNTAFIRQATQSLTSGDLARTAKDYFGIGGDWKIGVPSVDGVIPPAGQSADETASQYIGQGHVTMNPLQLASMAATVESGTFRQPVLLADQPQPPAARTLAPGVLGDLRSMMNAVFTDPAGTAHGLDEGLSGRLGGKTGTAEVGATGTPTNSWFTGYRDDLAVSAEVIGGGLGAQAAAPAVVELLRAGNAG
ncbi:penicillin-binding transpeptidase domain-containing protein [Kitasatospora nipponensis]